MSPRRPRLKWGVEQRLEFIEFQLFWEGGINRADITEFFGISVPQASNDLSKYQELVPKNVRYDRSEKRYFATDSFKPKFLEPDADQYLIELSGLADSSISKNQSWLSNPPIVDAMPIPHRRVDVTVLKDVLAAIRENNSIEVNYQSMNPKRPKPEWRRITPLAFGSDGLRWHVRAYCHIDLRYKDFLLSRCLDARDLGDPLESEDGDLQWNELFDVNLIPNPKLGDLQRKVIAKDYEMTGDRVTIPVRRALLYYFKKRLRLDVAEALDDPKEAPVIVENKAKFEAAIEEASR